MQYVSRVNVLVCDAYRARVACKNKHLRRAAHVCTHTCTCLHTYVLACLDTYIKVHVCVCVCARERYAHFFVFSFFFV